MLDYIALPDAGEREIITSKGKLFIKDQRARLVHNLVKIVIK
ncbi:hypothetical protein PWG14_25715 [Chromobacterium amazonense]|nr:hypothetical protein [Chromobacterium amazonense]MDE1715864.1 hypothetical protein [Chromobacterium amazonense]